MDHQQKARSKASVAARLRLIRNELYGENGGNVLAGQLGMSFQTWVN
jgi:hypothetical protein